MIWLPWTQFTWSANAVSGNNRAVRVAFLIGTIASIPMAASVTTAFEGGGLSFAIPLAVILSLGLVTLVVGLDSTTEEYSSVITYSIPNIIAVVALIGGAFFDREVRIVIWIAAIAVVIAGTIKAGSGEWLVRPGHFAERHGLILIVALGEVIVAVAIPVVASLEEGDGIPGRTMIALIASGAFACLLWWAYFDRASPALEHRHDGLEAVERGRFARDVYTYGHIPIIGGVILLAAALEEITLHPKDVLPIEFRWMFFAGLVMFFGGVGLTIWRSFRVIARERLVALAVMLVPVLLAGSFDGLTLLVITDVLILLVLVSEHIRIEGISARAAEAVSDPAGT